MWVDVIQNTDEWLNLRIGKITGSHYSSIMANYGKAFGDPAKNYAMQIALERATGRRVEDGFSNSWMERGHELEQTARDLYELETFETVSEGKNPNEAFRKAVEKAQWDYGHAGYTGTIAEKDDFVIIPLPEGKNPFDYANDLVLEGDPRVDDKWGPAGCIDLGDGKYLFFGWASS